MRFGLLTAFASRSLNQSAGRPLMPPAELLGRVEESGADGLALDRSLAAGFVDELLACWRTRRSSLPIFAVENVCPWSRAEGADLAAADRDEADVALEAATATVHLASELGEGSGTVVALRLGEVAAMRRAWPIARRAFLRGHVDEDPERRLRVRRERSAAVVRHLDAARRNLHRLARVAESAGVVLGIRNPGRPHALPFPVELEALLADLRGAPIAPLLDVPAAHLLEALGVVSLDETLAAWKGASLAFVADACGPVAGLAPGQGEVDLKRVVSALGQECTLVFTASASLTTKELLAGMASLRALR